jgi:DNA repair exonuclease SbcCD nuclease subunit
MSFIFTSDIHLDDSPQNEYRWGLFPWLADQAKKYKVDCVIIGGDICDKKNNHDASFVNRVSDTLVTLASNVRVILYKGNHDFVDEGTPFFKFINLMNNPNLVYYIHPTEQTLKDGKCLFLPCTRNHVEVWKDLDFSKYDFIFCHETFTGAISESGIALDGIPRSVFADTSARIISGDVHRPQELANITYAGAPFRCRFGDSYTARVLYHNAGKLKDLHYPCLKKHTIELFDSDDDSWFDTVSEGDQVKFRVNLKRSEIHDWDKHRETLLQKASDRKITVHGIELRVTNKQTEITKKNETKIETKDFFAEYCKREKIGEFERKIGEDLLSVP